MKKHCKRQLIGKIIVSNLNYKKRNSAVFLKRFSLHTPSYASSTMIDVIILFNNHECSKSSEA